MDEANSQSDKENVTAATATATTTKRKKSKKGTKDKKITLSKPSEPGKKAYWTSFDSATLVSQLKLERDAGNQADNSWKTTVWTRCAAKLNSIRTKGAEKTPNGCRDHWSTVSVYVPHTMRKLLL